VLDWDERGHAKRLGARLTVPLLVAFSASFPGRRVSQIGGYIATATLAHCEARFYFIVILLARYEICTARC